MSHLEFHTDKLSDLQNLVKKNKTKFFIRVKTVLKKHCLKKTDSYNIKFAKKSCVKHTLRNIF